MNTVELLALLRSRNVRLWAENGQLRYNAPKGVMTDDLLAELRTHKHELIEQLKNAERFRRAVSLRPVERTDTLPLSFAQERLWFLYHLFPESRAYNFSLKMRLAGFLDIPALQKSLQALINRHESLRTCFTTIDDKPVQVILDDCPVPLVEHDLKDLPEAERETAADELIEEELLRPFDLTRGPVIRAALLGIADQDHILVITVHHIATDAWSNSILQKDLADLYNAEVLQQTPALPALPVQYVDFAHWQRQWLTDDVLEDQLRYWRTRLAELPTLELPLDRPRPPVQTHSGASHGFRLSKSLCRGLQSLSRQAEVTLATTLLAAFQVLLGRYTGQTDIVVGMPIANRTRSELENLVGFFVNSLVMRSDLPGDPTFQEVLTRVHDVALGAYEHQDLPFEQLVDELQPERDLSRNPLFQTIFAFQNVPLEPAEFHGLTRRPMGKDSTTSHTDLECFVEEADGELCVTLVFNTDLFDQETIERLGGHFHKLLTEVVRDPAQRVFQLALMEESERQQLVVEWNATATDVLSDVCFLELFEAQLAQRQHAIALVFDDQKLTYAELNMRANQLARYLGQQQIVPEDRVGVYLPRGLELVVSILGIWKAGGAYVPLDPSYPRDRIAYVLGDSKIKLLLTHTDIASQVQSHDIPVVCLDSVKSQSESLNGPTLPRGVTPDSLAYVIYTSGSTGTPKGVLVPHRGLANIGAEQQRIFGVGPESRVLQFASSSFDASVFELVMALQAGGTLYMGTPESLRPGDPLLHFLREHAITNVTLPPSALAAMVPEPLPALATITVAGEACPSAVVDQWGPGREFFNLYGPTETTIWATMAQCRANVSGRPPIGRPIANTQVYVLDGTMQPSLIGVPGELYIGGIGIARGYLNCPGLTAERFVPDPFSPEPGARLYKTGDVVRYRPDGTLEFKGRRDHQVKVRGYRIELGEIEAVLTQHPTVAESVALVRQDEPGEKRLVAYLVPAQEPISASTLRRYLQERIPDYMVPAYFVMLDALPVTPNGKVDRRALPVPDGVRPELGEAYQAPSGRVEQTLARIWTEVLRIDQVGRHDNFFELGGDSILSIQIVAKASQAGLRVTPRLLFQHQTIAGLSEVVEALERVTADQGIVTGPLPLSPVQHWFFAQEFEEPAHWNMAWVLEAKEPVDPETMAQVLDALLRHHDALRLRFVPDSTGWKQELGAPSEPVPFTFVDLSHFPSAEAEAAYAQEADRLHATLDLSEGPLIRVALFRFGEGHADRVLIVFHHLAVDGISWRILLDDLQTAYDQLCANEPIQLPPKTTSFKEWTERLVQYARSDTLNEEREYWRTVAGMPSAPVPHDFADGVNTVASTRTVGVVLEREDTQALLQEIPEVYHTQINDVLLAALVDVMAQWSQQDTVCLDLEGHGREELFEETDLSRTLGWFTSIFPVVLKRDQPANPGELLKSVKEQLRQIPLRGIGYGLLKYLRDDGQIRERLGESPEPEVAFNYLGQFDQVIASDGRWTSSGVSGGANRHPRGKQPYLVAVNARVMDGVLQLHWSYSEAVHRRETIESLANDYLAALLAIIRHCQSPEAGGYTPSDFPLAGVSQADLEKLL